MSMTQAPATSETSKTQRWTGVALSTVAVLFMILDAILHIAKPAHVVDAFARLGFPLALAPALAVIALVSLALYVFARTAVLGSVLLTGYLGGAVAVQLRIGSPASETIFPIIVAILLWGGLYLRDARLRALFPIRN